MLCLFLAGLTFKETWNTENTLATEVTIEDQLAQGLKIAFDTSFTPQTGFVALERVIVLPFTPQTGSVRL